jgi:hypothetical protein
MNEIFNSSFETGLRVLLLLSSIRPQAATIDRITAYDFTTIYGRDFGVSKNNLHGDSNFNFSELASKRTNCNEGIKEFVLDGLISIKRTEEGFTYYLNQSGKKYVESLSSDYAAQYLEISQKVHQKFSSVSDEEIINLINKKAINELRRKS